MTTAALVLPREFVRYCQLHPPRLHRQAQPSANTSMVLTIAVLANRRSSAMLRAASRAGRLLGLTIGRGKEIQARGSGRAGRGDHEQTVVRKPV